MKEPPNHTVATKDQKNRFKNENAIETMTIAIAIAKAYKRLITLKAKQDMFKPIPIKTRTS